ncbi:MAG: serine--tRNA ligase, partial [Candidatus Omnitrophica bacterium]|nr:serine--tRNA ligase [Candidatus Omnitrophota bacterium]
ALRARNSSVNIDEIIELDNQRKEWVQKIDSLREYKNRANEEIKTLLEKKEDISSKIEEMKEVSKELDDWEAKLREIKDSLQKKLLIVPNIPHSSVPRGDVSFNKIIRDWGSKRKFDFTPLTHIELSEHLDIIDFPRASKICGSNFALFKGKGAKLVRALINFMLDLHTTKHNYKEVFPPFLVNRTSMLTTGQLPNLEEDMYKLKDDDYFLIPTAEVPVTNIHRDDILSEDDLPIYYVSYTACFRREAGSYGKDTKGLTRVHQFDKVELVKFVHPKTSYEELEKLLADACEVIELLEIPYRVVLLATGDMSFASTKCYDIEIYAPGLDRWLEVSSCSNFEDFQARRGNIRYRDKLTRKPEFVHTLNGSGVALARLIVALLENYQNKDGSITLPTVLSPYYDGKTRIEN